MKRYFKLTAFVFGIFLLSAPAFAEDDPPQGPGQGSPAQWGGPNCSPCNQVASMTQNLAETANNLKALVNQLNLLMGQREGITKAESATNRYQRAYVARQQRIGGRQEAGRKLWAMTYLPHSIVPYLFVTNVGAATAGNAVVRRQMNRLLAGCPDPSAGANGAGGRAPEAYTLEKAMCQTENCLPKKIGDDMGQMQQFQGCKGAEQKEDSGAGCFSMGSLTMKEQGIQASKGENDADVLCLQRSMVKFGKEVEIIKDARGYTDVRQLAQADLREFLDSPEGKRLAALKGINPRNLLIRVTTGNPAVQVEKIMGALLRGYASTKAAEEIDCQAANYASIKCDTKAYDQMSKTYQKMSGRQSCFKQGTCPSYQCLKQMQEALYQRTAKNIQKELGNGMQKADFLQNNFSGMAAVQNAANEGTKGCNQATNGTVDEAMRNFIAFVTTPEFSTFVALLDDKYVHETNDRVAKAFQAFHGDTQFAENDKRVLPPLNLDTEGKVAASSLAKLFNADVDLGQMGVLAQPVAAVLPQEATPMPATLISTVSLQQQ